MNSRSLAVVQLYYFAQVFKSTKCA